MVTVTGRDGKQEGLGSGFIVGADGLIATNLHVIGEARPITVRLTNGKSYPVTSVQATNRALDLAVIKIEARDLPTLELGDSDALRQGQRVVALGNPLGLEHSVVAGVVSGSREIEGRPMIQLAIPIEPGNSGGPLLDDQGRVHGLLTMKSAVTANLGFAVKVNALKPLLEKPNPIAMTRWLTIGTLDPKEWTTRFGANWRQRAGRIAVEGTGAGFGGRALCLSETITPETPFELTVTVKLDDEAGAAGLVFAADGGDRHYGFYPSNGRLRLSRFDGSDVLNWNVLKEESSPHYRRNDWNTLKVRVEAERIRCWINDQLVIESQDDRYRAGKVGLAKFRNTKAEFKHFRAGRELPSTAPSRELITRVEKQLEQLTKQATADDKLIETLAKDADAGMIVLARRAEQLNAEAKRLRQLAESVHRRRIEQQLIESLKGDDSKVDLIAASLLVSQLDNPELDVAAYREEVERMAREIRQVLPAKADDMAKLKALNNYLFVEQGYHGSNNDYYNRSNSYLNEVLDDREGLPLTLSILYIELGRRLELNIVGLGIPGHFMVRHEPHDGARQIFDPFEEGIAISEDELRKRLKENQGESLRDEHLKAVGKRAIIERMLRNLLGNANRENDQPSMLHYLDAIIALAPSSVQERLMRAVIHYQTGSPQLGLRDTHWLLDNKPEGLDADRVLELHQALERAELRRAEQAKP